MAWEENPRICLHMQLIAILSRTGVLHTHEPWCLPDILRMDDFTLNVKLNYERSVSEQRDIHYPDVNENDPHWPEGVPCLER